MKIKKHIIKTYKKIKLYKEIKKHLKNLVADFPKEIQEIILDYNTIYSKKVSLEEIIEDASTNLYYAISEAYKKDWDKASLLDLQLEKLKQVHPK